LLVRRAQAKQQRDNLKQQLQRLSQHYEQKKKVCNPLDGAGIIFFVRLIVSLVLFFFLLRNRNLRTMKFCRSSNLYRLVFELIPKLPSNCKIVSGRNFPLLCLVPQLMPILFDTDISSRKREGDYETLVRDVASLADQINAATVASVH
jgi:hypothetical protein